MEAIIAQLVVSRSVVYCLVLAGSNPVQSIFFSFSLLVLLNSN